MITDREVAELVAAYGEDGWPSAVMVADWLVQAVENGWDIQRSHDRPRMDRTWVREAL